MPYNEEIETLIDGSISGWPDMDKKRMFGGICYLVRGNMCFGIYRDFIIVRCGVEAAAEFLERGDTVPFDITGRAMKGWVMVSEEGWAQPEDMKMWLETGRNFALTLPPK